MSEQLFKVTIDNITIEVPAGTTILNAARKIGGDVTPPAMCYYSKLEGSGGKCRTCLVEVSKGSEKGPRPMPKLVASCRTTVMDGMEVKSATSPKVLDARADVVEMLLINHPLDCPICDQAGECHLQDLSYEHGKNGTRYEFQRRTFHKVDLGDKIQLHMTRCILCYRCVFTADQITECLFTWLGPSITQSLVCFLSKRHSLQIHPVLPLLASLTSPHSSLRAVALNTSSPRIHNCTSPQHLGFEQFL